MALLLRRDDQLPAHPCPAPTTCHAAGWTSSQESGSSSPAILPVRPRRHVRAPRGPFVALLRPRPGRAVGDSATLVAQSGPCRLPPQSAVALAQAPDLAGRGPGPGPRAGVRRPRRRPGERLEADFGDVLELALLQLPLRERRAYAKAPYIPVPAARAPPVVCHDSASPGVQIGLRVRGSPRTDSN